MPDVPGPMTRLLAIGAVGALVLTGCGDDDEDPVSAPEADEETEESVDDDPAVEGDRSFSTRLAGEEEVPGPGDPDGSGSVRVRLRPAEGEVCSDFSIEDIGTPTAAHIHAAPAGEAGDVVVPLETPTGAAGERCADADADQLAEIVAAPSDFYVNVHNEEFPDGAIRGQLEE